MKKLMVLSALLVIFSFTSCSKDDEKESSDGRFTKEMYTAENYETIKDNVTGLEWVNDTRGCFAAIITPGSQCNDTGFGGFDDWRTPTADEMAVLMTEVSSRGMQLNYINTSCVIMSTSEDIWVFTENSSSPGEKTSQKPGNAGLRCVRSFK